MARLPRLNLPGYPYLVVQRGNNSQAIVSTASDYQMLLALIDENARKFGVVIHAYVLMGDHFQLLGTPTSADGLPQMMQALGRRYVRYFNDRQGRSGTLWEGRYLSTLMDAERYLLPCMAFMDLKPAREGIVKEPRDYSWSSHAHYVGLRSDRMVTPHALFWTLGNTPFAREAAYVELVRVGVSREQQEALTHSTLGGWALGDENFVADLQKLTGRRVSKTRSGRPVRATESP